MVARDIVVVGASAGGVEALCQMAASLPPGLPAAVLVVCHFPATSVSALPDILSRSGPLLARHARDGEPTYPGHIYVAPPDFHLAVAPGVAHLSRGPRENRFRPSIDPLFRSAARAYGPRAVAVLLSGALLDGVAGLLSVRAAGGVSVVQSPDDAVFPDLPRAAIELAGADHVAPASGLGRLLAEIVKEPVPEAAVTDLPDKMAQFAEQDLDSQARGARPEGITVFTCPECGGSLWQSDEDRLLRFRCHVGHVYAADALLADKAEELEAALWVAVRMFREKAVLAHQLAARARENGDENAAGRFEEDARLSERQGEVLRDCIRNGEGAGRVPQGEGR